jgi:outer membrane autotransporter protein
MVRAISRAMRAWLGPYIGMLVCGAGLATEPAAAQSAIWDATISNTHWYVPVPQLLAYASPTTGFANPIPIGDQTLWSLGVAKNGAFTGTSTAQLKIGAMLLTDNSTAQGFVTNSGQITIVFTPTSGGTPTVGLGQMRIVGGVPAMEMQMITGGNLLVTHWAYMLPYDPATFTPPPSQPVPANSVPQWAWTAGTPWRIVSPAVFGTNAPGRFVITNYQNGYFWGAGVGPAGSGPFTLLGSVTPEGKVLFNTLSRGNLTSLYGDATGGTSGAQMIASTYDLAGNLTGGLATMSLMRSYADVLAAQNNTSALGAATALYRVAGSTDGLTGPLAPAISALAALDDAQLSRAISQTTPVLAGAATQATWSVQRGLTQVVTDRLDGVRGGTGDAERNIWLKPLGGLTRQGDRDGVAGYRASSGGLVAGADRTVADGLALGGLLAYSHHAFNRNDDTVPNALSVSSYQVGLYGAYALRPEVALDFQFDAGLNKNSESRALAFIGSAATASYDSTTLHAGAKIKQLIPLQPGLAIIPSLGIDFAQVHAGAYSESGAGALNLNVDAQSYRELRFTTGLKAAYQIAARVQLTADAGVSYNTLNQRVQLTATFAGGGDPFTTYGLTLSPWLYSAGLGLVASQSDNLDLSFRYGVQAAPSGFLDQTGTLAFRLKI